MKVSAVIVAATAAVVSAQSDACSLTSIPSCALPAIQSAISSATKCSTTDFACVCANQQALTGAATPGVLSACGQDTAINKVLPAVQAFCSAVTSGKCGSASSSAGGGASASSTEKSTAAPTSTVYPSSTLSTTAYPSSTTAAPTYSANGTATSAKPTSTVTAGAAIVGSIGSFGMLVLGALAAF